MKTKFMLSIGLVLSMLSAPALSAVCVGELGIVCKEQTVETELTLSAVAAPKVSATMNSGETLLVTASGNAALDVTDLDINNGTIIATTAQSVVVLASQDGTLELSDLKITLTEQAYIGDTVSLLVSRRDPNGTAETIEEKSFETFMVKGFETANIKLVNPASNATQFSVLRLINDSSDDGMVIISGVDDAGNKSAKVSALIPANSVLTVNSADLEMGSNKLVGSFGDGEGKWRVRVDSDFAGLRVQSLVRNNQTGTLTEVQ